MALQTCVVVRQSEQSVTLVCDDQEGTSRECVLSVDEWQELNRLIDSSTRFRFSRGYRAATEIALRDATSVKIGESEWLPEPEQSYSYAFLPFPSRPERGFWEVLDERRSKRSYRHLDCQSLATVLYECNRVLSSWPSPKGFPCESRVSPSAGARHPLLVNLVVDDKIGAPRGGLYRYHPHCHAVSALSLEREHARRILTSISREHENAPAVVIVFTASVQRTLSRYPNGTSLIFQDCGALATIHSLCASALGLSSCILSAPNLCPDVWSRLCPHETLVGGIALG